MITAFYFPKHGVFALQILTELLHSFVARILVDTAFEMNLFSSRRLNLVKLSHPMREVIRTRILVLQIFTGYFFFRQHLLMDGF